MWLLGARPLACNVFMVKPVWVVVVVEEEVVWPLCVHRAVVNLCGARPPLCIGRRTRAYQAVHLLLLSPCIFIFIYLRINSFAFAHRERPVHFAFARYLLSHAMRNVGRSSSMSRHMSSHASLFSTFIPPMLQPENRSTGRTGNAQQ